VTEAEIEAKVIDIVAEQMGVDKGTITRETNFTNDLHADSLDTVELVMEFEDEFETSIPDEQAEKIQTIGQAIEFIKDSVPLIGGRHLTEILETTRTWPALRSGVSLSAAWEP
jgi:acyl carrier protein